MLNAEQVKREIETGLSAVCAWCNRYWEAKDRMGGAAFQCGVHGCGGPSVGMAFPKYTGPRPNKATYCFVCGGDPAGAVEFHRTGGMLGFCMKHEALMRRILARVVGDKLVVGERIVQAPKG